MDLHHTPILKRIQYYLKCSKLQGKSVSDLYAGSPDEYTNLRNPLVEADWLLQDMVEVMRKHKGLKESENCPLNIIHSYAGLTNEHIETLLNTYKEISTDPDTWMVDASLVKSLKAIGDGPPRLDTDPSVVFHK
jgi:hypothetical protein